MSAQLAVPAIVPPSSSLRMMSLVCCRTFSPLLCGDSSLWWLFPLARLVLVLASSLLVILLHGGICLATVAVILVLWLVAHAVVI